MIVNKSLLTEGHSMFTNLINVSVVTVNSIRSYLGETAEYLRLGGTQGPIRDFTICNICCVYRTDLILGE